MLRLTEYTSYAEAQAHCTPEALWALFDGDATRLNIADECLGRHRGLGLAVRVARREGPDQAWSFDELADWSGRFANWLGQRGVPAGARVAIMLEPSLPFYFGLFGTMQAGRVAVPLFTLFGPDGVALRIDDCRPALLLTSAELAPRVPARADLEVVVADEALLAEVSSQTPVFQATTGAGDMAMYQYTSGTTRELPEAVRHRHRAIVTVMLAALYGTGVRPGERFFCPSSPAWGHGLWHGTLAPLALGATVSAWAGPFEPARMLEVMQEHEIENLAAAATHYRMLRTCGRTGEFTYQVRKLSFTGEPIDSATAGFCEAAFGTSVRSMYGTTEVGVVLASYPGAADFEARPGALGKPLPGVEVEVHDAAGRRCAPGTVGEIVVRRRGQWIRTRDLGHCDGDGYFFHDGRADDVIISAGWTMSAVEIEDVLLKHADVREAAVIGVPDALRGQVVKAFIVSDRPGDAAFAEELQAFTKARLSRHEYPRQIAFTEALPKTPAGKVNRGRLRQAERRPRAPAAMESEDG